MVDIQTLRTPILALHRLPGVDALFTLYYDETNNIRKLMLTPEGMNIRRPNSFVLGGIFHSGAPRPIDLISLRDALKLQPTVTELKLKHLGKGGFLDLLGSTRLETFLRWISDEGFLIHFQVTDPLYWSIVDIVDSILTEADAPQLLMAHMRLKNSLYELLRKDVDATAEYLGRYSYPDVGRARRVAFIAELLDLVEAREDELPHFDFYMLKGLLQIARGLKRLPYLEDEEPNVLIKGFGDFFLNRLSLFNRAQHILDDEKQIETYLSGLHLTDCGAPLRHFRFANSKSEAGIQASDPVAGLLGKFFSYVNQTSLDQITLDLERLSEQQRSTLSLLARLLDRSTDVSPAFAGYIISEADRRHAALILNGDILAI